MDEVETVVIGAGVVGLACAKTLAESGREVVVIEQADAIGTETSSRNSEVIHAGIYYPQGSLKARLCVRGRRMLYEYCVSHGVPHRRCGKLIVATTDEEVAVLDGILAKARGNGVDGPDDLIWLSGEEAMSKEPALRCTKALLSPSTGIIDSHALMLAYQGDAEAAGAMVAFETPVIRGEIVSGRIRIETGGATPMALEAREVVVAAGLHSQTVLRSIAGYPNDAIPGQYFCKGNYFIASGRAPFSHLIYPVPVRSGLGVHVTLDMAGGMRFGPDTQWIGGLDEDRVLEVDPARGEAFYAAIRRYYPDLADGVLIPGYAGIRPKLNPQGAVGDDFQIDGPAQHGVPGLVGLCGIESPGLTSSLAIAAEVLDRLSPQ
ncbi:MAG: NAD(P)/FAD-dependent oxidoreductase [Alphaproteobacteria bacterium]|nr:NAD(P)/FAD-dependent oxidoreductase [Alphaproteobacteria bacterium]MBO6863987.1 NAD(P)/FAD-dependent oxidoreductase [Alphaproteobacteria bacterium]